MKSTKSMVLNVIDLKGQLVDQRDLGMLDWVKFMQYARKDIEIPKQKLE